MHTDATGWGQAQRRRGRAASPDEQQLAPLHVRLVVSKVLDCAVDVVFRPRTQHVAVLVAVLKDLTEAEVAVLEACGLRDQQDRLISGGATVCADLNLWPSPQ